MSKKFHLFVGLPRTGSTTLSMILNQNPKVYVASSTAMYEVLHAANKAWHEAPTMIAHPIPEQLVNLNNGITESMWKHRKESIIIDRNRAWGHNMALADKCFANEVKIITTIRDLPSAMASWVTLYKKNCPDHRRSRISEYATQMWDTVMQNSVDGIVKLKRDYGDRLLLINYDEFVAEPKENLAKIEQFLKLPKYDYDLENISNDYPYENIVPLPYKGTHSVRPKLEKISEPVFMQLEPMLQDRYSQLDEQFRRDLGL
jgi:sulfotransferase